MLITLLRAIEPQDLDLMYIIENDPTNWQHGHTTAPYSYHTLKTYLQNNHNDIYIDGQLRLAIAHHGFLDLTDFSPQHHRAQIGIILTPEAQGQGQATKALHEAAHIARTIGIHQLWAIVDESNTPANRLFHRAHYTHTATLPQWHYHPTTATYTNANLYIQTLL